MVHSVLIFPTLSSFDRDHFFLKYFPLLVSEHHILSSLTGHSSAFSFSSPRPSDHTDLQSLPGRSPGPAFHLNANDPPKLVFPALNFKLRSRLIYLTTCLISPVGWVIRFFTLTCWKQNSYCTLLDLSASPVFATCFSGHLQILFLSLCPINHQVL